MSLNRKHRGGCKVSTEEGAQKVQRRVHSKYRGGAQKVQMSVHSKYRGVCTESTEESAQ
jgi:ATP-dependent Clp protease adapter protein ClpS